MISVLVRARLMSISRSMFGLITAMLNSSLTCVTAMVRRATIRNWALAWCVTLLSRL